MGIISDQENLTRWHYNRVNSANPVTANSWRNMYVRLYLELYLCTWILGEQKHIEVDRKSLCEMW